MQFLWGLPEHLGRVERTKGSPLRFHSNAILWIEGHHIVMYSSISVGPTASQCELEILKQKLPVFKSVTMLLKAPLYTKLMQLPHPSHRVEFLELKYGLHHRETVIYDGYVVEPSWCIVSYCDREGLIDFNEAQVLFVEDDRDILVEKEVNCRRFKVKSHWIILLLPLPWMMMIQLLSSLISERYSF